MLMPCKTTDAEGDPTVPAACAQGDLCKDVYSTIFFFFEIGFLCVVLAILELTL